MTQVIEEFGFKVADSIAPQDNPDQYIDEDEPNIGGIRSVDAFLQSGFDVNQDGTTFPIDWTKLSQFRPDYQRRIAGGWHYVGQQWLPQVTKIRSVALDPHPNLGAFLDDLDTTGI